MDNVREQAVQKLYELSDEEVAAVLRYMEVLHADVEPIVDPTVGMFSAPTALARQAKQILRDEITSRSGWTQKKD
ncbi:MAG: hypothetical protein U0521_28455 [Anaerolineae bacterium]